MMLDLEQFRIRKHDANGALTESGFIWFRPRSKSVQIRGLVAVIPGFVLVGALVVLGIEIFTGGYHPAVEFNAGVVAAVCVGLIYWLLYYGRKNPMRNNQKCILVFCSDGRTLLSKDSRGNKEPELYTANWSHANIQNIEGRQATAIAGGPAYHQYGALQYAGFEVMAHFADGQATRLAWHVHGGDAAQLITTQLQDALRDIRRPRQARR